MYKYNKTYNKSSHISECENRSLLLKGRQRGQKSVLTELDWAIPCQSSETAGAGAGMGAWKASIPNVSIATYRNSARLDDRPKL